MNRVLSKLFNEFKPNHKLSFAEHFMILLVTIPVTGIFEIILFAPIATSYPISYQYINIWILSIVIGVLIFIALLLLSYKLYLDSDAK